MAAISSVRVSGKNIFTPGAYSVVDTSGAQTPGLVEGGRVCIIGDAPNGKPGEILRFTSLDGLRKTFSTVDADGSLGIRTAATLLYTGGNDDLISGSPTEVLVYKTNPDTQSTLTLSNASGDCCVLTSEDYGAAENGIGITISAGTTGGVSYVLTKGTVTESGDSIGGSTSLNVSYTGGIANVATLDTGANGLEVNFETSAIAGEQQAGTANKIKNFSPANRIELASGSAADTYQSVIIYGLDGANAPMSESIKLNGTATVTTAATFTKLSGIHVKGMTNGDLRVDVTGGGGNALAEISQPTQQLAATITGDKVLNIVSDNASDTAAVTITGLNEAGDQVVETLNLNGTTQVNGAKKFHDIVSIKTGAILAGATVTVKESATTLRTLNNGGGSPEELEAGLSHEAGLYLWTNIPVDGVVNVACAAQPGDLIIRGRNAAGSQVAERISVGAGAASNTATAWASIDQVELGGQAHTGSTTISGEMVNIANTQTLEQAEAALVNTGVFTSTSFNDARLVGDLDIVTASNIKAVVANLTTGLADFIEAINDNSALCTAAKSANGTGLPALGGPLSFAGGTSGTSLTSHYTAALQALQGENCNIIVPLSTSDAVHALVRDHCKKAATEFFNERNAYVGLDPTKTIAEIYSATAAINNEYVSATAQSIDLFDENGTRRTYSPVALACVAAGMQASSEIGTPLTYKYLNALSVTSSAFDPALDGEAVLQRGLMICRRYEGLGTRWVRSITTYQKKSNRIFTEMSATESTSACLRDLRQAIEPQLIGQPTSIISADVVRGLVDSRLTIQQNSAIIASFSDVTVTISGDLVTVSFKLAPSEPTNFVLLTAHIQTVSTSA